MSRTFHARAPRVTGTPRRGVTKQGAHGTLYRYAIRYDDGPDSGFGPDTWHCWAYDRGHALDLWHGSPDADTGWRILAGPTRVTEVRS